MRVSSSQALGARRHAIALTDGGVHCFVLATGFVREEEAFPSLRRHYEFDEWRDNRGTLAILLLFSHYSLANLHTESADAGAVHRLCHAVVVVLVEARVAALRPIIPAVHVASRGRLP
ncbi:hypothetical protein E2C01_007123 [Portunus trituberculatus]|uniref:Uncharacterized protein n=1 Tax=Portunus trituberculatus TaxID=210409 RepID=A0A5B7CY42_PORTR|nr:hypothetical protein [Portunus trituberculatus]